MPMTGRSILSFPSRSGFAVVRGRRVTGRAQLRALSTGVDEVTPVREIVTRTRSGSTVGKAGVAALR
jgi:hypothetical protein